MKTMHKISALFLVSITISSFAMEPKGKGKDRPDNWFDMQIKKALYIQW